MVGFNLNLRGLCSGNISFSFNRTLIYYVTEQIYNQFPGQCKLWNAEQHRDRPDHMKPLDYEQEHEEERKPHDTEEGPPE